MRRKRQTHTYRGVRVSAPGPQPEGGETATLVSVDGGPLPPTERALTLAPYGFDWGDGHDCLALAHALLAYDIDTVTADQWHESFAADVVSRFARTGRAATAWILTSKEIRVWLDERRGLSSDTQ